MTVLVDTTIWSVALRRPSRRLNPAQRAIVAEWRRLAADGTAAIVGPVRQEILSGVRDPGTFNRLKEGLAGIDCISIGIDDYDQAAHFYNELRALGVAGGSVDLLICAVAHRLAIPIFTTDRDFDRYARHLEIQLHQR